MFIQEGVDVESLVKKICRVDGGGVKEPKVNEANATDEIDWSSSFIYERFLQDCGRVGVVATESAFEIALVADATRNVDGATNTDFLRVVVAKTNERF